MRIHQTPQICSLIVAAIALAGCNGGNDSKAPTYDVIGTLNDTGVVLCANAAQVQQECPQTDLPHQDAEFGRDAQARQGGLSKNGSGTAGFDWTKLDSTGSALAIQNLAWNPDGSEQDGSRWSCVKDHVTGLVWEVKESDPQHPRYAGHTYRWWLDSEQQNGGFSDESTSGTCGMASCDTQSYVNWVNQNGLCGQSDWRMPTVAELSSIAVLANVIPAVDTSFFPNVMQPRFFTNQSLARDPSRAWYVYFSDGSVSSTNKGDASHVRLVRGGNQQ